MRIAVGQISCESNTFASFACDLEVVRSTGYIYEGDDIFALRGTDNEVAGALDSLSKTGDIEILPLLASRWNSSAVVATPAHRYLRDCLLARLGDGSGVDGVYLSCHGSMVAEDSDDPEGELAEAVRKRVGSSVPIAMSLDLHGNVTDRMVRNLDLIVGYEHYPHDDAYTTGVRAAQLLVRTARGEVRPSLCRVRLPMILTAYHASTTGDGPFATLMRDARNLERKPSILSVSCFHVGSYIDVPEMGCSTLVITDGDPGRAREEALALARAYWARRREFLVEAISIDEAIRRGREIEGGPVILLNTADTTGGGAAGDSIDVAAGLVAHAITEPAITMVVDVEAARACHAAGIGAELSLGIGHHIDPRWGKPTLLRGTVSLLSDGRFKYTGGIFGGTVQSMGPSAVLEIGNVRLLIQTNSTYDWADEPYRSVGFDPAAAKWVEAKNMMNFRRAYGSVSKAAFVLDAPGPTPPDMRSLPFSRAARPWYPLDEALDPTTFLIQQHPQADS